MSKMLQITGNRKKSKKMGEPSIINREDEDIESMDVDSRLEERLICWPEPGTVARKMSRTIIATAITEAR